MHRPPPSKIRVPRAKVREVEPDSNPIDPNPTENLSVWDSTEYLAPVAEAGRPESSRLNSQRHHVEHDRNTAFYHLKEQRNESRIPIRSQQATLSESEQIGKEVSRMVQSSQSHSRRGEPVTQHSNDDDAFIKSVMHSRKVGNPPAVAPALLEEKKALLEAELEEFTRLSLIALDDTLNQLKGEENAEIAALEQAQFHVQERQRALQELYAKLEHRKGELKKVYSVQKQKAQDNVQSTLKEKRALSHQQLEQWRHLHRR